VGAVEKSIRDEAHRRTVKCDKSKLPLPTMTGYAMMMTFAHGEVGDMGLKLQGVYKSPFEGEKPFNHSMSTQ